MKHRRGVGEEHSSFGLSPASRGNRKVTRPGKDKLDTTYNASILAILNHLFVAKFVSHINIVRAAASSFVYHILGLNLKVCEGSLLLGANLHI